MNFLHDSRVRDLLETAIEQGFRLERNSKSYKLIPPDKTKEIIVMACTPGSQQQYYRTRERLRKSGCIC
jgi:maleate cis-trans isomerase